MYKLNVYYLTKYGLGMTMNTLNALTVGPIVGHTDFNSVRLWGRGEYAKAASGRPRRAYGVVRIKERDAVDFDRPHFFKMSPNFDMTGIVSVGNLETKTKYLYQMGWFYYDKDLDLQKIIDSFDWDEASSGEFSTANDDVNAPVEFAFGSCRYLLKLLGGEWFDDRGDKTFRSILGQIDSGNGIDKFLMVGDQIYADDLNIISPDSQVDEYLSRYRDAFSQPYLRSLMSKVSTYMTLDDHEIEDNWPSKSSEKDMLVKYPAAMHAYQVYQAGHSSILKLDNENKFVGGFEKYYYTFADGCCDFFVTDTRTERDYKNHEIISEEQMEELVGWLVDGSGKVKVIVTSVPFFPDTKKVSTDKWSGFRSQRDRIISAIRDVPDLNVVFLSGDVHCSMSAELDISNPGESERYIYSVISSSFYWPYPHMKRKQFRISGAVASSTQDDAYKIGRVSEVFSGDNFTRVSLSQQGMEVEVYCRKGEQEHTASYSF